MARILVADDSVEFCELMANLLGRFAHEVDVETDARRIVGRVGAKRYDLLVLDLLMPEVDGLEVLRAIRGSMDEEVAQTNVVILSAVDDEASQGAAMGLGASGYIVKGEASWFKVAGRIQAMVVRGVVGV